MKHNIIAMVVVFAIQILLINFIYSPASDSPTEQNAMYWTIKTVIVWGFVFNVGLMLEMIKMNFKIEGVFTTP